MKNLLFALCASVSLAVCAADAPNPLQEALKAYRNMTPEEREAKRAAARLESMKEDGGIIPTPNTLKGNIRFVNAQKRVTDADIEPMLKMFGRQQAYDVKVIAGNPVTAETAETERKRLSADVAVFLVDNPRLGMMLTAPEERWALVNVAALAADNPKPAFLAARVRKELARALSFMTAVSTYDNPLMNVIKKPADLDEIAKVRLPVDVIIRRHNYLKAIGVTKQEYGTFRNAVIRGLPVSPTNEYQKAIFDEETANRKRREARKAKKN